MKVKLIQTGGFAGLTRAAEVDVNQDEAQAFIERLKHTTAMEQPPRDVRDAFNHVLIIGDQRISFSPEDVPEELKPTIEKLLSSLK